MMKKALLFAVAIGLLCLPVMACAEGTLHVQGSATLTVAPDQAVLSIGFFCEDPVSSIAQKLTADTSAAILAAVQAAGIPQEDIATTNLNTSPVYDYVDGTSKLRGYQVTHTYAITIRDITKVGDVLDAALKAGANQTNGISYSFSKEQDVYLQALGQAVQNASAKADALAIASGVWLGNLQQITELTSNARPYAYAVMDNAYMKEASVGGTVVTGDLSIEATVDLVYQIR